jgi:uncharacterized membrane protein
MDLSNFKFNDLIDFLLIKLKHFTNLESMDLNNLKGIILTYLFIITVSLFILWLIKAIGLYTMAKNRHDKFAFIAFIPYFCMYTKGKILGKTKIFGIEIPQPEFLLPFILISMLFPYTRILSILLFIVCYYAILYKIYKMQVPNVAIVLIVLSIILPVLQPFFIFFIRNTKQEAYIN